MEKNIETIQNLNEEELQDITGGCGTCDAHIQSAKNLTTDAAKSFNQAAEIARLGGPEELIHNRVDMANDMIGEAKAHMEEVKKLGHYK